MTLTRDVNSDAFYIANTGRTRAEHELVLGGNRAEHPDWYSREALRETLLAKAEQGARREESQDYTLRYLQKIVALDGFWYRDEFTDDWLRAVIARAYRHRDEKLGRANVRDWLADGDSFIAESLPPRTTYIKDKETGASLFFAASLNQIFAFRGIGKSVVSNELTRLLVKGGEWLRFASEGGKKVLLMDAELPGVLLQKRLQQFVGKTAGQLKILSPELMPESKEFPNLSTPEGQDNFRRVLDTFEPQVIVFDTLTRCFRFDTNEPDVWLTVNDFLIDLRSAGHCVIIVHHGGKNGTQRGRTDGDDNLDVSIKLAAPYGWVPGDGLAFAWEYEKVRHGGNLPGFEAEYTGTEDQPGEWRLREDDRMAEVLELSRQGKSSRAIATALDMSQSAVSRVIRKHQATGLARLNQVTHPESGQKGDSV